MKHNETTGIRSTWRSGAGLLERPGDHDLRDRVRDAHRAFPTGVTIVTTQVDGKPIGLAVNAFSSVSMEPPLVLVCVNSSSQSHASLRDSRNLGISILGRDQSAVAMAFARSGGDKFSAVDWRPGVNGAPLIDGAAACFEVELEQQVAAGTHTIFLCRVLDAVTTEKASLVYAAGGFYDGARLFDAPS
jgi:flavin reductase (DIM6/NTAB) family NADH-FMN oxidoreductase RutF